MPHHWLFSKVHTVKRNGLSGLGLQYAEYCRYATLVTSLFDTNVAVVGTSIRSSLRFRLFVHSAPCPPHGSSSTGSKHCDVDIDQRETMQVIDLCSDEELKRNPDGTEPNANIDYNATGDLKQEISEPQFSTEYPHQTNGKSTNQPAIDVEFSKNVQKKRKREGKLQQAAPQKDSFADDDKIVNFRAKITQAQLDVERCHEELNKATDRLENLQKQHAERLKLLRRQADENFDWLAEFPWQGRLRNQLNHVFHLSSFRPLQHEALNATLLKRDVFAILPTGAGKSLIYQLAAVVDGGLTLVVTPLISLSMDQRMALRRLNIRAESIDSITDKSKVKKIYNELLPNHGKVPGSKHPRKRKMRGREWIPDDMEPAILFVTPEQIAKSKRLMGRLEVMHENGHLSRICIDEAHCSSLWGHDFRSEYRKLGILRRQLPDTPILALTATSSIETTEDVSQMLETRDCVVFRGSIDRPNLFYEVREKGADDAAVVNDILRWIKSEFAEVCGIIYVLSRKDAVTYAESLRKARIKVGCYHGDLEQAERSRVHAAWSDGRVQVVVATIAFGLGIDNPRVRFVIHATMATSLEGYYQESGRAGRDGKPAKCILLHRAKEFPKMSGFVADKGGDALRRMYEMYRYASSRGLKTLCRRAVIAASFGEKPRDRKEKASCCDVCAARCKGTSRLAEVDVTELARSVGRIVLRGAMDRPDEKVTLIGLASDWGNTGAKGKRVRGEEKAVVRGICVDTRLEILIELICLGVLEEYHRHTSYSVNAYVTAGDNPGRVFDGGPITIVVTKEKAMALVQEGCQIVSSDAKWAKIGHNGVVEETVMDGWDAGQVMEGGYPGTAEIKTNDISKKEYDVDKLNPNASRKEDDDGKVDGGHSKNEEVVADENYGGQVTAFEDEIGNQHDNEAKEDPENVDDVSDEELIVRRKRMRK